MRTILQRMAASCAAVALTFALGAFATSNGAESQNPSSASSSTAAGATVTATVNGREIRASGSVGATIETHNSEAVVKIGTHVLQIGKDRLQLDEGMPSTIPATTQKVEIQVEEQMLVVLADGKEVLRAKMED